ncbi:MAG: CopD family protein [Candidatus Korobacteraceae bacterium]
MRQLVDLFEFLSVILRAGTLVFQSLLLGGVLFILWVSRNVPGDPAQRQRVETGSWTLLRISILGLIVIQGLYLFVDSSVLMASAEIGFGDVVGANFFISGSVVLGAALVALIISVSRSKLSSWALIAPAIVVMAASLMTNHAASRLEGRPLLVALTATHEIATGFWIGGLPYLVLALFRDKDSSARFYVTERFSRLALISVILIVVSGLTMSVVYIGSWQAILGTAYGVMVLAKAVMLGVLVLLGGINFLMLRNMSRDQVMPRLRRLIEAEVGIGITVILTAASLTSQPPAVDQPNDIVSFHQIVQRFRPTLPRLTYSRVEAATPAARQSDESAAQQPIAYNADGELISARMVANSMESEANHHWMGVLVLGMGVLALLARTGKAPWAEYWPLLLIGIAVFIILQADSECWPMGWKSVGACFADPEVFQHRMAALVCIGFAIFELRVRKRQRDNDPMALVFPLMCAAGGAVLLTHQHAIANVKENLLVELTHVPMGVLAVFAGWARWLELRLPAENRKIPSWVWPVCFVLIGAGLLNYREM